MLAAAASDVTRMMARGPEGRESAPRSAAIGELGANPVDSVIVRLLEAYRSTVREADRSPSLATRAIVTDHVARSSSHLLAELTARHRISPQLIDELRTYQTDLAGLNVLESARRKSILVLGAFGVTSTAIVGVVLAAVGLVVNSAGNVVAYGGFSVVALILVGTAKATWDAFQQTPAPEATAIIDRTLSPIERDAYKEVGGSPLSLTIPRAWWLGEVLAGPLLYLVFSLVLYGAVLAWLNANSPPTSVPSGTIPPELYLP